MSQTNMTQITPIQHQSTRIAWIDIARAVAMVLVFTGHLGTSWFPQLEPLMTAIYTFHMPLFFLLSGLFFKPTIDLLTLIAKRARTLLVPYYVFSVFALAAPIVKLLRPSLYQAAGKSTDSNPFEAIVAILFAQGNAGLWFLWSLFVGTLCPVDYGASRPLQQAGVDHSVIGVSCYRLSS